MPAKGDTFVLSVTEVSQERINSDKVRALLSPEQLKDVISDTSYSKKTLTRYVGEKHEYWNQPNPNVMANMSLPRAIDELGHIREQKSQIEKGEKFWSGIVERMLADDKEQAVAAGKKPE